MKNILILLIFCATFGMLSCKKDKVQPSATSGTVDHKITYSGNGKCNVYRNSIRIMTNDWNSPISSPTDLVSKGDTLEFSCEDTLHLTPTIMLKGKLYLDGILKYRDSCYCSSVNMLYIVQ